MLRFVNNSENINLSNSQNLWQRVFSSNSQNKITITNSLDFKYLLLSQNSQSKLIFDIQSDWVKWDVFAIYFGQEANQSEIQVNINSSNSHINVYLLSFVTSDQSFELNGKIDLWKDISNSQWHLLEKIIVLSDKVKIKATPRLDAYSKDIQATHGLSIDKLDSNKMFYLKSKWLSADSSQKLIINWHLQEVFSAFSDIDSSIISEIEKTIQTSSNFLS